MIANPQRVEFVESLRGLRQVFLDSFRYRTTYMHSLEDVTAGCPGKCTNVVKILLFSSHIRPCALACTGDETRTSQSCPVPLQILSFPFESYYNKNNLCLNYGSDDRVFSFALNDQLQLIQQLDQDTVMGHITLALHSGISFMSLIALLVPRWHNFCFVYFLKADSYICVPIPETEGRCHDQ